MTNRKTEKVNRACDRHRQTHRRTVVMYNGRKMKQFHHYLQWVGVKNEL